MHITERAAKLKRQAAELAGMNPFMAATKAKELLTETAGFLEQLTRHTAELAERQAKTESDLKLLRQQVGGLIKQ